MTAVVEQPRPEGRGRTKLEKEDAGALLQPVAMAERAAAAARAAAVVAAARAETAGRVNIAAPKEPFLWRNERHGKLVKLFFQIGVPVFVVVPIGVGGVHKCAGVFC